MLDTWGDRIFAIGLLAAWLPLSWAAIAIAGRLTQRLRDRS